LGSDTDASMDVGPSEKEEVTYTIVDSGSQKGKNKLVDSEGYSYCVRVGIGNNYN